MSRKLLALAADNRGVGTGLRLEASAESDTTTVYIYDTIDSWWGISAAAFAAVIAKIETPNAVLRVNSPGGDVFEARAMMAAIAEHPAKFTAKIDGLCASAATLLTLPCDSVEIVEGGFYMIHNAWTVAMGDEDDMRATADLLAKVDGVITAGYATKTGKATDEIAAMMDAETWLEAQEAVDAGFANAVVPLGGAKAQASAFNLAAFAKAPKALTEQKSEIDDAARLRALARLGLYERSAA